MLLVLFHCVPMVQYQRRFVLSSRGRCTRSAEPPTVVRKRPVRKLPGPPRRTSGAVLRGTGLRTPYARSGTDARYAATRSVRLRFYTPPTRCPVLRRGMGEPIRDAMCGTEMAAASRCLCNVRYCGVVGGNLIAMQCPVLRRGMRVPGGGRHVCQVHRASGERQQVRDTVRKKKKKKVGMEER
eukprot:3748474-Rhodomonas_salina.1